MSKKITPNNPFDVGAFHESLHPKDEFPRWQDNELWKSEAERRKQYSETPIERSKETEQRLWNRHIQTIIKKHSLKRKAGEPFEYRYFDKSLCYGDLDSMLRKSMYLCMAIEFPKAGVSSESTNDPYGGADDFFVEIISRLRDSEGPQIFRLKDGGGEVDLRDVFRDFLEDIFQNKTLPEFLELLHKSGFAVDGDDDPLSDLSGKERQELGRLRTEKKKWEQSIKAAVQVAIHCVKESAGKAKQKPTRADIEDFLHEFKLPKTTEEKIISTIPSEYRQGAGRPKKTPER